MTVNAQNCIDDYRQGQSPLKVFQFPLTTNCLARPLAKVIYLTPKAPSPETATVHTFPRPPDLQAVVNSSHRQKNTVTKYVITKHPDKTHERI